MSGAGPLIQPEDEAVETLLQPEDLAPIRNESRLWPEMIVETRMGLFVEIRDARQPCLETFILGDLAALALVIMEGASDPCEGISDEGKSVIEKAGRKQAVQLLGRDMLW